ncbi:MAG: type II toxin-antitoxin system VapC family toxin [Cyanobacteria bacterium J06560_2]
MKLLLDTHIWLWYSLGDEQLPADMRRAIASSTNLLYLSPISIWKTVLLTEKGTLTLPPDPYLWIDFNLKMLGANEVPVTRAVATLSRQLFCPSQNMADRLMAATAVHYNLVLVTVDPRLLDTPSLQLFEAVA